jgi:mRNA-degrading endonuclease RelE of RelBE toxin-antitoxin system
MPVGMMARTESSLQSFTVEIMPTAWKQIAHLSQDVYRMLRERLRMLADLASAGWHPSAMPIHTGQVRSSLSFMMGDYAALYEVDLHSRLIRLLEVARRLPTETLRLSTEQVAGHA